MMIGQTNLYSFQFEPINSNMYMLLDKKSALIIDPCVSQPAWTLLRDMKTQEAVIILTHEHYDHISGVNWLRELLPCRVVCSAKCAQRISNPDKNLSRHFDVLFMMKPEEIRKQARDLQVGPYECRADKTFEGHMEISWGDMKFELMETPGHSKGSICIRSDKNFMFSGDTLVSGSATITRLPGGSRKDLDGITRPWLEKLKEDLLVFPGHGRPETLGLLMGNLEKKNGGKEEKESL